jgi:Holliday junction resolvasome RuvABC endonuclease subunit
MSGTLADALTGMSTKVKERPGIAPLTPRYNGRVGCFDQTLSKTGSIILISSGGKIVPYRSKMFEPTSEEVGNEGNLEKATLLFEGFLIYFASHKVDLVAHEAPPVGGGKLMRPESSLMAATALRCAAKSLGIPVRMVAPQKVKNRLTGNTKAEKKDVKLAIERMIPEVTDLKPWNQDVSDACGVGIVAIEEAP